MIRMKRDVPPCMVSDLALFSPFPYPHCAKNGKAQKSTLGQVSRDGMWAWIARDSIIEVFSTHTGERCSAWCFGAVLKNTSVTVTAVTEFFSSSLTFPCLLIALESENVGALLCMFDVKTSKVIKVIELPYKVTSLEVVSREGGACMETHPLSSELRCMFGIAAVGTEGGHILFVDLCLDEENFSDELAPNKATFVTKQTQNIPAKREIALARSQHLCLSLNEDSFHYDFFEYKIESNISPVSFSAEDITVSTMKYFRNMASLAVGFSFGGIQLWNLQHLFLQYTIPLFGNQQSVVQFAFQEPENDPRNFCYLWAITGHYQGEHNRPDSISVATLYSLAYARKDWLNNYGFLYQEFQGCSKRFEYFLSSDPYCPENYGASHCSRLITCHVVPQNDILNKLDHEDPLQSEEWNSSEDLSVCVLAWETWPALGDVPSSCFLVLFDINQWYQAQMPSVIRCSQGELCSYLGVFSLQEITKITNKTIPESLLDIYVIPHSLTKFKCLTVAEEFFYPSSLSFRILCISEGGILQASYLGTQRQLLSEMTLNGPGCIVDPKELYNFCLISGLMCHIHDSAPGKHVTTSWQREALLTLALENSMSHFLTSCVQQWSSNEFTHAGCSLKFLLDWGWKRVTQIKNSIDKICLPLFNCSGQGVDKSTLQILHSYESQLKHLINVVVLLQNLPGPTTEQGQRELQLRKEVLQSIGIYLQVLLWLYDCHLLPEHLEGDEYGEDEVSYPISRLTRTYSCRRLELQKLHSSVGQTDVLLVDGMVSEMGISVSNIWEKLGGNGMYPPPSFYASLSTYLLDGVPAMHKHLLMFYLLLDISAFLSDRQSHLIEKLMRFPSVCNISSSIIKLTHAFWLLDHQDFEEAISVFLDPVILSINIEPWHHTRILKSFLYQGQEQKALKYMNVRKPPQHTAEEVKLHLSVLLANGLTAEAFNYQRQHQDHNVEDLLNHFFIGCQQTHALDALLQLPLNSAENAALTRFLHSSSEPQAQELLVIFYLLRCRPLEAASLNDKLVSQIMERSIKSRERATSRNALVTGFLHTLPEEQKKFAQELSQIDNVHHIINREVRPQPLSTSVTSGSLAFLSYSDMLNAVMSKITDTCHEMPNDPQTPLKTHLPLSIESAPFIGSSVTPHFRTERRNSDVIFATPVSKRSILHAADYHEFVSPTKKFRFMDTTTFKGLDSDRRRNQKHLTGEVLSLLQTPPVCRKSLGPRPIEPIESTSGITPQSILKVRNLLHRSLSPQDQELSPIKPIPMNLKDDAMEQDEVGEKEELEVELIKPNERAFMLNDDINSKQLRFQVPAERNTSPLLKWVQQKHEDLLKEYSQDNSSSNSLFERVASRPETSSELNTKRSLTLKTFLPLSDRALNKAEIQRSTDRCNSPCFSDFSSTSERSLRASPRRPLRDGQQINSPDKILPLILEVHSSTDLDQPVQVEEQHGYSSDISFEENRHLTVEKVSPMKLMEEREILDKKDNSIVGNESEMHFLHLSESESESESVNLDNIEVYKPLETPVVSDGNISDKREEIENVGIKKDDVKYGNVADNEQTKEAENPNVFLLTPEIFTAMTPPSSTPVTPQKEVSPNNSQDLLGSPFQSTRSRTQSQSDSSTSTSLNLSIEKKISPDKSHSLSPKANKSQSQEKSKGDKQNMEVREKSKPVKDSELTIQTLSPSLVVHQEEVRHGEHMEWSSELPSMSNKKQEENTSDRTDPDLQFTFSQPHISDDPGTLAALDSSHTPVPQFVFSPPVTRARSRQKKLDETLSSSFMSAAVDTSFSNAKKSPAHTLLLDTSVIQTVGISTPNEEISSVSVLRRKSATKNKKNQKPPQLPISRSVINLVSPLEHEESSSINLQQLSTSRHSMILRRSRIKKKSVKLW